MGNLSCKFERCMFFCFRANGRHGTDSRRTDRRTDWVRPRRGGPHNHLMLPSAAHIWVCFGAFLPPDAMHKRSLCRCAVFVRPSVHFSVCHVRVFRQKEREKNLPFFCHRREPHHSSFRYQTLWKYSDEEGVECRWGRKKSRFLTTIWLWHR